LYKYIVKKNKLLSIIKKFRAIYNKKDLPENLRFLALQSCYTANFLLHELNSIAYPENCNGGTMIDVGTGLGIIPLILNSQRKYSNYICIDLDNKGLTTAKRLFEENNFNPICADAYAMPLKNSIADILFARYVLQHVSSIELFLLELKKIMKSNSKIVIIDVEDDMNIFYPELPPETKKVFESYEKFQKQRGGDRNVSKKLPYFLFKTGFKNVEIKPFTSTFFVSKKDCSDYFRQTKEAFLVLSAELELVKDELIAHKYISPSDFHRGLNNCLVYLNSSDGIFMSKTEFLITATK
jgi:ubiquinone/menaquinone biosynthesis C-methylase UbiE